MGSVVKFNDEEAMDVYDGDDCNLIKGTDGLFFPPFMNKNTKIWAFAPPICRSIFMWYEEKTSFKHVALSRFVTHFNVKFLF